MSQSSSALPLDRSCQVSKKLNPIFAVQWYCDNRWRSAIWLSACYTVTWAITTMQYSVASPGERASKERNMLAMTSEILSLLVVLSMAWRALPTCKYGAAEPFSQIANFTGSYSFTAFKTASHATCSHQISKIDTWIILDYVLFHTWLKFISVHRPTRSQVVHWWPWTGLFLDE